MDRKIVIAGIVGVSLLAGCGVERLPPPSAPTKEVPENVDVPLEPPAPGTGRVILDTNGEKATAIEVTGSMTAAAGGYSATIVGLRPLCTTPCAVDLPYGSHPILLRSVSDPTRQSETALEVGSRPKVFRHELGERKDGGAVRTVGSSLVGLGALAALTGATLWGVAALTNSASSDVAPRSSLDSTGQAITAIGLGAVVLGIPLLILGRPTERPGATTEWSLPGAYPAAPESTPAAAGGTRL